MSEQKLNGFSLMEMMVVLLIVAVVAAASAPLMTKKMSSNLDSSPWVYTGVSKTIAYNMDGGASTAIIGTTKVPNGSTPKLYIESSGNEAQIGFGKNGSNDLMLLTMDSVNKQIGFSNITIPNNSIIIGHYASTLNPFSRGEGSIAIGNDIINTNPGAIVGPYILIGNGVKANSGSTGVAIGNGATVAGNSVVIGSEASSNNSGASVLIGQGATATAHNTTAVGASASVGGIGATAIGTGATALHTYSTAIGADSSTTSSHQIVLGTANDTVCIPGKLIVDKDVTLAQSSGTVSLRGTRGGMYSFRGAGGSSSASVTLRPSSNGSYYRGTVSLESAIESSVQSDRRLKNIGEKFTAGVNELSKLDFFHYTFKKDETKTPHVGVIAQDLQKVFPDAVTKGDDGFLRIRWEDMFYAAINAIKELNTKITEIADNLMNTNSKVEEQSKIIEAQQETINNQQKNIEAQQKYINEINSQYSELVKQNKELIRRIEKIEQKI